MRVSKSQNFEELLQGRSLDVLCLSDTLWDEVLWTNRQYAVSTLAHLYPGARVLYIETPSFVIQRGTGLKGTWPSGAPVLRRSSPMPFCRQVQERVWALHPPLPVPLRMVRKRKVAFQLLQWETLLLARLALHRLGFGAPLFWTYHPYGGWYAGRLGERFCMYECLDEHSASPYYTWDRERVIRLEEKLMRAADVVFTVSPSLQERKAPFNPNTFMVGNPANYELFARAQRREIPRPPELAQCSGPILGFYGALASYKIDADLLCHLAEAHPEWNLVLIGPVKDGTWNRLSTYPNVLILSAMSQLDLVHYVGWFDVLLMPYQVNEYTKSSRPLKIHEYFATGKPVVSTYVPAQQIYRDLIFLADDLQSFAAGIRQALSTHDPDKRQQRIAIAREQTWANKVQRMMAAMVQCGLLETSGSD